MLVEEFFSEDTYRRWPDDPTARDVEYDERHRWRHRDTDRPLIGPHQFREMTLMLAGRKPAALISDTDFKENWQKIADENGWLYAPVIERDGTIFSYAVVLPGQEARLNQIKKIYARCTGRFSPQDSMKLGRLLGYTKREVETFMKQNGYYPRVNEARLMEGRVHRVRDVPWRPHLDVAVYENPSVAQMTALVPKAPDGGMRGFVDGEGRVFIWAAAEGTHADVVGGLGILDELAAFFLVAPGGIASDIWKRRPVVAENRGIRLVMRPNEYERVRDLSAMRHLFPAQIDGS